MSWPLPACSLKGGNAAYLGLGNSVDPGIGDDHDGHGDVEADKGGGDGISAVQADIAAGHPRQPGVWMSPVLGFMPV